MRGRCSVHKFINAFRSALASLNDFRNSFVAKECTALGVMNLSSFKKNNSIGFAGIDVQRAGLARLAEHLNNSR